MATKKTKTKQPEKTELHKRIDERREAFETQAKPHYAKAKAEAAKRAPRS